MTVVQQVPGLVLYFTQQQTHNKSSAVAEMGDHLATIDMGQKVGRGCCGGWVSTGSPSNWAEAHLFTKWHLDPYNRLATIIGMPCSST